MRCESCGFENPSDAWYCEECGGRLARTCPACGHEVGPAAKFCRACGAPLAEAYRPTSLPTPAPADYTPAHLAERIRAEQAALVARGLPQGERKTITALFADMAGSTALIHDLDPEEARRLIDPVLALMMEAVHHYAGYVAKSLGDGILALFGAPIAYEDHPQRALFTALRMQEAMRRYADRIRLEKEIPLQIRVGVHTGEVVVRSIRTEDLHTDYDPVGQSIHLASRMEGIATPGSIVVSEPTYRLTEGYFEFKALGTIPVKGVPEPLSVYEVLGPGPLRTRLQVAARRGLVRFVGRQRELEQLQHAREQARAGHGQLVGVVGEPGVGKSRLFHEFKRLSQRGCLVLETFSVSHGKAFPYQPLIELLKNYFQITAQEDERRRRERITGKVLTLDRSLDDCLPYLFYLLGIPEPTSVLSQMDPQLRRRRTFEVLKRLLVRESLDQPLELLFEDLQWLDSETEAFLNFFSEAVASARILLLVNYRPEYRHGWGIKTYYTQLRLDPLGQAEAEELVSALLGNEMSLLSLKRGILAQTEGNPFFMEEVVQTLVEEKVLIGERGQYRLEGPPTALHIPTTVQGVLADRMDRLVAAEKEMLQMLAVIGKEFPLSLLKQVVEQPEEDLHRLLARLQEAEFIYERPAFPELEYTFKHGLTQEVAYQSLLSERRSLLHERTAQAIEALFQGRLEDHCSELAHHYRRCDNLPKAVEYLQCVGRQALQRSAHREAIHHLTAALALLQRLPDTPERAQRELALQLTLGPAWMAAKGYAVPEVEATYTRALALCRQVGETPQLFSVLVGLRRFYNLRAEYQAARELGEKLLSLVQSAQDPGLLLEAHSALGTTLFYLGELAPSRAHLEQVLVLYDRQQHRTHAFLYGLDPGILGLTYMAWVMWHLGYPDQALKKNQEALTLGRELSHPFSLAHTVAYAAKLHQCRREGPPTQAQAEAAITLSTEQGFPYSLAWGTILRGWALAEQGRCEEGIAQIRQGLATYRATGAEMARSYFLALLAEALGKAGQTVEALEVLTEAFAVTAKTGEVVYEAELYRLKGELTLEQSRAQGLESGAPEEAEACFQKAIAIAHQQGSLSLELRAVTSLSRLWQQQGKKGAARQRLAEIYERFTEGFDTTDLQGAKSLLAQLAA